MTGLAASGVACNVGRPGSVHEKRVIVGAPAKDGMSIGQRVLLNHGDNSALSRKNYQQTLATAIDGIAATGPRLCPVPGCMFNSLVPDHPCYRRPCKNLIHNLCAQGNNLCSKGNELNMYCSVVCKGSD